MTILDARGMPVSQGGEALALYEEALGQLQSYVGDPVATIDRALAAHPGFLLGHAFRAGVLAGFGERRFNELARTSVEAGRAIASRGNERERGLLDAAGHLVDGAWDRGCQAYERVLIEHPRDAFAVQVAHLFDFFRGDATNLRNRIARVLPHWSPSVPGYSYLLGMYAFGLEEHHQYEEADETAARALALQPKDGWAVHAAVHVREMQGRIDEGIQFLESRVDDWSPDNGFAFHNWWHLALFHLDRGAYDRVLELYDAAIYPTRSDLSLQLVDATSLLWRLHLQGRESRERFAVLSDVWEEKLDRESEFYAFNDVHALMAFLASGRDRAVAQLLGDLESAAAGKGLNATMAREVGLPLARALCSFEAGRYGAAADALVATRDIAHRFGGSHAQRDFITLTLIEAALRAGRTRLARHYIAERTVQRPASALGWRLHARAVD